MFFNNPHIFFFFFFMYTYIWGVTIDKDLRRARKKKKNGEANVKRSEGCAKRGRKGEKAGDARRSLSWVKLGPTGSGERENARSAAAARPPPPPLPPVPLLRV